MIRFPKTSLKRLPTFVLLVAVQILLLSQQPVSAGNSVTEGQKNTAAQGNGDTPIFREYRGVQIGMSAEETRKKLGDPKEKGDDQDFFVFGDKETAQIVYDKSHKVTTVSVDFLSGASDVPAPKLVVGSDIEAKPDGSIYKMIRYPKAGCWVSYNRTAGASPLTTVTIQKID